MWGWKKHPKGEDSCNKRGVNRNSLPQWIQLFAEVSLKLNLDAIHDTVHEMARDEARHGKAFKGLLDRYFK